MLIINNINEYILEISHFFKVSPLHLLNRKRSEAFFLPRQFYYYFGKEYLNFKNSHLAAAIGFNHSSGINGFKQIKHDLDVNNEKTHSTLEAIKEHFEMDADTTSLLDKYDDLLIWSLDIKSTNKRLIKENEDLKLELTKQKILA